MGCAVPNAINNPRQKAKKIWPPLPFRQGEGKFTGGVPNVEKEFSDSREPVIIPNLSLPRRRESSNVKSLWIPAFAGMTFLEVALIIEEEKILSFIGLLK